MVCAKLLSNSNESSKIDEKRNVKQIPLKNDLAQIDADTLFMMSTQQAENEYERASRIDDFQRETTHKLVCSKKSSKN